MIRNAVQQSENVRNSLVLNYKSAALSGVAAGAKLRKKQKAAWRELSRIIRLFGRRTHQVKLKT
jgi:hypothetical protein